MQPRKLHRYALSFALVSALGGALAAQQKPPSGDNPRPGQKEHRTHKEWQGAYPTIATQGDFKVVRTFAPPHGFLGNLAYDIESGRLWLVSLGPPTNQSGPSTLYELDPTTGKVLAQAAMPFKGDLSEPVYIEGFLYQSVFHESKVYKIDVRDAASFGRVVTVIPLPTLVDLKLGDESHPVPFIEFGGVAVTPDKNLMIHADDVGELITLDRDTGRILNRVRSLKALGGITTVPAAVPGSFYVLGNSDPRGGYCALSFPPALSRTPDQKDISWALIDPATGEVLASIRTQNSRAYASTVELMAHERVPGASYGRMRFLATGEEGVVVLEWTPTRDAY
jgi:hypothetical protein